MEKTVRILNDEGLHARPAGVFAKKAGEFKSTVEISAKGTVKNAKSIMTLMSLGLKKDDEVTLIVKGPDESQALDALVALIHNKFQA
jgi:phosphocarrier protein HPr